MLFRSSLERHEALWLFAFVRIALLQFLAVGIDEEQFAFSVFLLALDLRVEFFGLLIAPEMRPCSEERGDLRRAARLQGFESGEDLTKLGFALRPGGSVEERLHGSAGFIAVACRTLRDFGVGFGCSCDLLPLLDAIAIHVVMRCGFGEGVELGRALERVRLYRGVEDGDGLSLVDDGVAALFHRRRIERLAVQDVDAELLADDLQDVLEVAREEHGFQDARIVIDLPALPSQISVEVVPWVGGVCPRYARRTPIVRRIERSPPAPRLA